MKHPTTVKFDSSKKAIKKYKLQQKKKLREKFNIWLGYGFDKKNKRSQGETHRWLLCKDKSNEFYDCGCCLTDKEEKGCKCVCHYRIGQIVDFFWNELKEKNK
jgi:hypothetical protein